MIAEVDGEQTLLFEEHGVRGDIECESNKPGVELVSLNTATSPHIVPSLPELSPRSNVEVASCGRSSDNSVVLSDSRVSSRHFAIYATRTEDGEVSSGVVRYELEDLSANGTWVNAVRVGRGRRVVLSPGDEVVVLPSDAVGKGNAISFYVRGTRRLSPSPTPRGEEEIEEFQTPPARRLEAEVAALSSARSQPAAVSKVPPKANDALMSELSQDLTCGVCTDLLHRAVVLTPCLHSFCAACYLTWRAHKGEDECPLCRNAPEAVYRNCSLNGIVETFLKANPSLRRHEDELRRMDARERVLLSRLPARPPDTQRRPPQGGAWTPLGASVDTEEPLLTYRTTTRQPATPQQGGAQRASRPPAWSPPSEAGGNTQGGSNAPGSAQNTHRSERARPQSAACVIS